MKFLQKSKKDFRELETKEPSFWFKNAAYLLMLYCGLKLLVLYHLEYIGSLLLLAKHLESKGNVTFINNLPQVINWSNYYFFGFLLGIAILTLVIVLTKKQKTKRR